MIEQQTVRGLLSIEQFELGDIVQEVAGTCYIIPLEITSTRGEICLRGFDLALPWEGNSLHWLPDPHEISASCDAYRFPGSALYYPRKDVINHHSRAVLRPGRCIEGLLVGFALKSIPPQYKHGFMLDLNLSVITGAGPFSTPVKLKVDRTADLLRKVAARLQQHKGLFEVQEKGLFEGQEREDIASSGEKSILGTRAIAPAAGVWGQRPQGQAFEAPGLDL